MTLGGAPARVQTMVEFQVSGFRGSRAAVLKLETRDLETPNEW
jgi:hypothetical protein